VPTASTHLVIEASAPVRICDNGGWTDTWFGAPGRVLNMAVRPGVEISISESPGAARVVLDVENFGDRYTVFPGKHRVARHPLIEAAIDALPPPRNLAVEIGIRSEVPAGCGTGTSAAVGVALVGGLTRLRSEQASPRDIAYEAHRLEVSVLGSESGIQDQLSAVFGGINYIEIGTYPDATVRTLPAWDELGRLLTLIYLGRSHDSSAVHCQVIESTKAGASEAMSMLREAAVAARDAVIAQDLQALGRAIISNTEAQRLLHPALVGTDASRVIELARAGGAIGWKVNGAGGEGGSLTILSCTTEARDALEDRFSKLDPRYRVLPIQLTTEGLRVRTASMGDV
jgi:D-glycero-alpha-D-manno-heptose-7-phosphate kinase